MCGIVGYVGPKKTQEILIDGLERLEYRGYDSAGIALFPKAGLSSNKEVVIRRCVGRVVKLKDAMKEVHEDFMQGIAHTRWATHGVPSETNAHPHRAGRVYLVHNGIMENYIEIKEELLKDGNTFESQTDTEVFAHLIERELKKVLNGKDFDALSLQDKTKISLEALRNSTQLVE